MFIIGHLRGASTKKIFPIRRKSSKNLQELTKGMSQGYRVYDSEGVSVTLAGEAGGLGAKTGLYKVGNVYPSGGQNGNVYDSEGLSPSLRSGQGVKGNGIGSSNAPKIMAMRGRYNENRETEQQLEPRKDSNTNTLTGVQKDNLVYENMKIRKLTPKECWRLQGFSDKHFKLAAEVNSPTQLYRQAGNAVTVNVIEEIAKRLKEAD